MLLPQPAAIDPFPAPQLGARHPHPGADLKKFKLPTVSNQHPASSEGASSRTLPVEQVAFHKTPPVRIILRLDK